MDDLTKEIIDFGESVTNAVNGLDEDQKYNDVIVFLMRQVTKFLKATNALELIEFKNQKYALIRGMTEAIVNFWYIHTNRQLLIDRFYDYIPFSKYNNYEILVKTGTPHKKQIIEEKKKLKVGFEKFQNYENSSKGDWSGLYFGDKIKKIKDSKNITLSADSYRFILSWSFLSNYSHANPLCFSFESNDPKNSEDYFERQSVAYFLFFVDVCNQFDITNYQVWEGKILRKIQNKYPSSMKGVEIPLETNFIKLLR